MLISRLSSCACTCQYTPAQVHAGPALVWPVVHVTQLVEPHVTMTWHGEHGDDPAFAENWPTLQSFRQVLVWPAGHAVHDVAPLRFENVPVWHVKHRVNPVEL